MYDEVMHWKKSYFKIPLGNVGKSFVAEMARLYTLPLRKAHLWNVLH